MKLLLASVLNNPEFQYDYMDLGLGYLAAVLQREGHTVALALKPQEFKVPGSFEGFLRKESFDVVGLKIMSASVRPAQEMLKSIKTTLPGATVLIGGPHVSCDRENLFRFFPEADYGFHAEGEIGFPRFLKELSAGRLTDTTRKDIPNLIWKEGPHVRINPPEYVRNLDDIPLPAWELMDPRTFSHTSYNGYSKRYPIAPLIQSRGCPFRCTFCAATLLNEYDIRARSPENVMEEIRLLVRKFGVRELQLFDSNCAHTKAPLREVCRRIVDERLDITWNAPVGLRLDFVDRELVTLMKRSGCFQVSVGIESASPRILKMVKKNLSPEIVRERIQLLRDGGIEVLGSFMMGFPTETLQEIQETIAFSLSLPLTAACYSILTPIPGSEIYQQLFKDRTMDVSDLESLDYINYENNLSEVPYPQLRRIQKRAYLRFHLRPRILWRVLRNMDSLDKARYVLQRAYLDAFH